MTLANGAGRQDGHAMDESTPPTPSGWRARFEASALGDLARALGAVDFGNRILLFGANMLLSVLPLIVLLSAIASHRVDVDLSRHLGLSQRGAAIVAGLFRKAPLAFSIGVLLSLVLSAAGTLGVARSVQTTYESAFATTRASGWRNLLRCVVWAAVTGGLLIADGAVSHPLDRAADPVVVGIVDFIVLAVFFAWSARFLLRNEATWWTAGLVGVSTALCWMGLGVFAALYFSSSLVSDSGTYGTIGVVFTLLAWFIAMGAVIALGAVLGAVAVERRGRDAATPTPSAPPPPASQE
jgi:membrane protein